MTQVMSIPTGYSKPRLVPNRQVVNYSASRVIFLNNPAFRKPSDSFYKNVIAFKGGLYSDSIFYDMVCLLNDEAIAIYCQKIEIRAKRAKIRAKIFSYADLPDGFNGHDGHAPARRDINNAVSFIRRIPKAGLAVVRTMVAGDGDVGFEWEQGRHLEIGFINGTISFSGDTPDGEEIDGEENYNGTVPKELKQLMSAIFPK